METETPTLEQLGLAGEAEEVLDAAARSVIKEPTERWKARTPLITKDGEELPERVRVWRTINGREAWLPTAMIRRHMRKRHQDGTPVFTSKPPQGKYPEPIEQSCVICAVRSINKKFFTMFDYEGHMEMFHPREWGSIQREEDRKERQEERELMRQLVTGRVSTSDEMKERMAKVRAARGKKNG